MSSENKAYIYALTAVLLWSTVATAFKIALEDLRPELIVLFSSVFASIILLVINILDKNSFNLNLRDLQKSLLSALFNPFLYYLVLFESYNLLPAQVAQPLNYTWPIVLTVLSTIFLKEKLKVGAWIGLAVSFIGVVIISNQSGTYETLSPLGMILAVSSSIIWGVYWIINIRDSRPASQKLFLAFFIGSIYTLMYIILMDIDILFTTKGLIATAYIGLFEMGITFILWMQALKLSSQTAKVSKLVFLSPFLSLFFISFILKEEIQIASIIGLIVIVLGISLQKIIK